LESLNSKSQFQTSNLFGLITSFNSDLIVNNNSLKISNGLSNVIEFSPTSSYINNKLTVNDEIEGGKITANDDIYTPENLTVLGQINTDNIRSNNGTITIGNPAQFESIVLNGTISMPLQEFYNSYGFTKTNNGFLNQFG
jgi:hypothetical protein